MLKARGCNVLFCCLTKAMTLADHISYAPVSHRRSRIHSLLVKLFFLSSHTEDELRHELRLLPLGRYCLRTLTMFDRGTVRFRGHIKTHRPTKCYIVRLKFQSTLMVLTLREGCLTAAPQVEQHLEISSALFFQRSGELGCSVLGPTCTHATFQLVE